MSDFRTPRISTDKFGQPFQVVGCKDKKGSGFCAGYVTLGKQLYKIEPSESKKDGVDMWVRITKIDEKKRHASM